MFPKGMPVTSFQVVYEAAMIENPGGATMHFCQGQRLAADFPARVRTRLSKLIRY